MKIGKFYSIIIFTFILLTARQARAQQQSLYNDIRAHQVGDVITVILTENISGSSTTKANTKSKTSGSAKSGISGNFVPFKPEFGANAKVTYGSDENISADQKQLLHGTVSVRIKKVNKNGDYLIAGKRSTEINGERHELYLKGYVRPSDISQFNQVLSYRIADAKIRYQKERGRTEKEHRPGFGRKLFWGALGLITVAAAFLAGNGGL